MKPSRWDLRIERANQLSAKHPFATEPLQFFIALTRLQAQLYSDAIPLWNSNSPDPSRLRQSGELPNAVLEHFPEFLDHLKAISPVPLAHTARGVQLKGPTQWRAVLASSWLSAVPPQPPSAELESAIGRMFLQPFAECAADQRTPVSDGRSPSACPYCFEKPFVGVLRPEGDGGKRFLVCSMCATEWHCGRILCPACGEQNVEKLAIYSTEQFPHVRIEACDTCRYYIKTVDLTKTGRAIPVVDELATIPLNLWANERGYQKLQTNLLGF